MSISTRFYRYSRPPLEKRSDKQIVKNLMGQIKNEIEKALEYTSNASIYSAEETVPELTSAQISVLTLFYGLLVGDLTLCASVVQFQIPQLRSSFLRVWLADDFFFSRHDVGMVLSMLSFLMSRKDVLIPIHILTIFGGLVQKYGVADCCSKELLDVLNEGQKATSGSETNTLKESFQTRNVATTETKEGKKFTEETNKRNENSTFYISINENVVCCSEDIRKGSIIVEEEKKSSGMIKQIVVSEDNKLAKYDVVDSRGRTLLHHLAMFGRKEAVRRILEAGLHPDIRDNSGKTALHLAVEYDHSSTVELLLNAGADVNARTKTGKTPLSFAYFENGTVSKTWKIVLLHGGTV